MLTSRHSMPHWQIAAISAFAVLWVILSILMVMGRGDVESYLQRLFDSSVRVDAFFRLNETFPLIWSAQSVHLLFCVVAVVARMRDLLTVLVIAPLLAFLVALSSQQWSDPDWTTFAGVCVVGWTVGVLAGGGYCVYRLCIRFLEQRDAVDPVNGKLDNGSAPR